MPDSFNDLYAVVDTGKAGMVGTASLIVAVSEGGRGDAGDLVAPAIPSIPVDGFLTDVSGAPATFGPTAVTVGRGEDPEILGSVWMGWTLSNLARGVREDTEVATVSGAISFLGGACGFYGVVFPFQSSAATCGCVARVSEGGRRRFML